MIFTITVSAIRYFVNAFFSYLVLNNSQSNKNKKLFTFLFTYILILVTFKVFVMDNPIITFASALVMFICLWVDSKKVKSWKFILTYSVLINLVLECVHFISFKISLFGLNLLQIPADMNDNVIDKKLILFRAFVVLLYIVLLFLIYQIKFINMKIIKSLSQYPLVPLFLIFSLGIVIYAKYHIKYTPSDEIHAILANMFLFLPISLFFIFTITNKTLDKKITRENEKIDLAFQDIHKKYHIDKEIYIKDRELFEKILKEMGTFNPVHLQRIIWCLIILKTYEPGERVDIKIIKQYIANIICITPGAVNSSCEFIIEKIWRAKGDKIAKHEEKYGAKFYIKKNKTEPTVKDFLNHMVGVARRT